jgi:lysophospholipase L1-like esterase
VVPTPTSQPSASSSAGTGGVGGTPAAGSGGSSGGDAAGAPAGGTGGSNETAGGGSGPGGGGSGPGGGGAGVGGAGGGSSGAASGGVGGQGSVDGFMPCPTNGDPCAVLPLGDSITEGYGSSGGGYRVELFRKTLQAGQNITFVGSLTNGPNTVDNQPFPQRHEGHGGYTIDTDGGHNGISGQITDSALSMYHPNIVLLMIGTNDLNGNVDVNNAPTRLANLMDDILDSSPDTLLVVSTIIPMANGNNNKVAPYNDAIVGLVDDRAGAGKHVIMVDIWTAFTADPNYQNTWMTDSLHPNDTGYAVLGTSFYDAISAYLP